MTIMDTMAEAAAAANCTYERFSQILSTLKVTGNADAVAPDRTGLAAGHTLDSAKARLTNAMPAPQAPNNDRSLGLRGTVAKGDGGICYGLVIVWLDRAARGTDGNFRDLLEEPTSGVYDLAHLHFRMQNDLKDGSKDTRANILSLTGLDEATDKAGGVKERDFKRDEMRQMSEWFTAAGARFFMIRTNNHAMGAVGARTGGLRFFDPNGGIVSATNGDRMSKFLDLYLAAMAGREGYQDANGKLFMVRKYKRADRAYSKVRPGDAGVVSKAALGALRWVRANPLA
jgi:hypothetical protein